ncbi:MAG: hypothetical protein ABIK09_12495 [Pseudomonadota bacterium]
MVRFNERALYVAIEGLDGSGKTTLYDNLSQRLTEAGIAWAPCLPTRRDEEPHTLERVADSLPCLGQFWPYRSLVYARRSRRMACRTDWSKPLILGDRSLVTSYAVYWHRFPHPRLAVRWVDLLEPTLPAPDCVLYLDLDQEELTRRKLQRGNPLDRDEVGYRPLQMGEAFQDLRRQRIPVPRLEGTRWHLLDARETRDALCQAAWRHVQKLLTEKGPVTDGFRDAS